MRATPHPAVRNWIANVERDTLFTTVITEAEIHAGIAMLPRGRRRTGMAEAATAMFAATFPGRILPLGRPAAAHFAAIMAARKAAGLHDSPMDSLIAATALAHGASAIATRDLSGFAECGLPLINPWGD